MATKRQRADIGRLYSDLDSLLVTFNEETDLACVLVSASYLDAALAQLLDRHLVGGKTSARLLENDGPIGSLALRADLAYAAGLLAKPLYRNCRSIAQVRNLFAHHHKALRFSDETAIAAVRELELPSLEGGDPDGVVARMASDPRTQYTMVAAALTIRVMNLANAVERLSSPTEPW